MCGRYTYYGSKDIVEAFDLLPKEESQLALFKDNFNVTPGSEMPIIIRGEQGHQLEFMVWGLLPAWSKSQHTTLKLINARKEGLFEKPMWKRLINTKRCIVPAKGFYEWKKLADGSKQPYYITPKQGSLFSFAGLWDEWHGPNNQTIRTYTIITTTPNTEMTEIHDRVPAILSEEQSDLWLSPLDLSHDQVDDILHALPDGSLHIDKVSKDVNSPRNNRENLIYPLED